MRILLTVFIKEIIDNLRDRRTLASALIMGPLFGPMLFAFVINLSIERSLSAADDTLDLPVIGQQHAPNLMRYLESSNIRVVDGPADRDAAVAAVKAGTHDVVVLVAEDFGAQFRDGSPAKIEVFADHANSQAERDARRAQRALSGYSQELATMRLVARGVSPLVMRPINVDVVDVSTPSGRSAILLGMMSYFFIFAAACTSLSTRRPASASVARWNHCWRFPSRETSSCSARSRQPVFLWPYRFCSAFARFMSR